MLQQVLEHIHNRFIKRTHIGEYSISGGTISPIDFLIDGQRFWIVGSILNDGIYTYHADGCTNDDDTGAAGFADEDFSGEICALAVPASVVALSAEILGWENKYGDIVNSPYTSEAFGGYSYTRTSARNGAGGAGWQDVFADRLRTWRKTC